MTPDLVDAVFLVAQPFSWVLLAEPLNDADGCLGDVAREVDLVDAAQNDIVDLHRITGSEGRPTKRNMQSQRVQLVFTNKTYNITHYGLVA